MRAFCERRKAEKRSSHKRKGDTTMPPAAKHKSSETNNWRRLFRKHTRRVFSRDITLTRTALISYLARKEEKGATVAECSHCVHPLTIIVQRGRCLICPALFSLLIVFALSFSELTLCISLSPLRWVLFSYVPVVIGASSYQCCRGSSLLYDGGARDG